MPLDCQFKKKSQRKILKQVKTGDVIGVAYGSKRAKLVKVFTGSMWAHSAVIIKPTSEIDSEPHVLEVARYSRDDRGIMVTEHSIELTRASRGVTMRVECTVTVIPGGAAAS